MVIAMAIYGSNEELISLLNIYRDKNYVNINFKYWLHMYPDMLNILFNNNYREYFDEAIKMYMPDILRKIIGNGNFENIYLLNNGYEKELFENIDVILDEDSNFKDHFCLLVEFEGFEDVARKNQAKILSKALADSKFDFPSDYTSNLLFLMSALPFFETNFVEEHKEDIENFLTTHFNIIDPQIYDNDLLFLFKTIRLSSENHSIINKYFSNHLEFIALVFANKKLVTLKSEKTLDFYVELIKDVMRIESASVKDMKLKRGAYSRALIIKNKVLKSGFKNTKKIPYHKRLLQPIIRQEIKYLNCTIDDVYLDFIELYERVDDLKPEDEPLVYEVFKEMLNDGVIMADPSLDNLGRLLKENIPFHESTGYNDDNFYIDNATVGLYDSNCPREILNAREVVVRDLDHVYYFKNIHEFIMNKLVRDEKIDWRIFYELGMEKVAYGPKFEECLDKYCDDLRKKLEAEDNQSFKK